MFLLSQAYHATAHAKVTAMRGIDKVKKRSRARGEYCSLLVGLAGREEGMGVDVVVDDSVTGSASSGWYLSTSVLKNVETKVAGR